MGYLNRNFWEPLIKDAILAMAIVCLSLLLLAVGGAIARMTTKLVFVGL